jgi:hypothetical protein
VTGAVEPGPNSMVLIEPFPQPGRLVQLAIENLILQPPGNKITCCLSELWRTCRGHGTSGAAGRRSYEWRSGRGWRLS